MDLTRKQQKEIRAWAKRTLCITEVRLFGSRAKGSSYSKSDVDLAVTTVQGFPRAGLPDGTGHNDSARDGASVSYRLSTTGV